MTILKATKDNSKAILTPFEQGAGETDWRRYQARVKGHGKVLDINAGQTTSTTLVTTDGEDIFEGDQLYLQEGLDATVKPVIAGAVSAGTQTLDIFGDGSCIALYNLNGNALDIGGNYNATWTGTEQYAQAVYGQGALFNGASTITSAAGGVLAVSFYLYVANSSEIQGVFYFNGVEVGISTGKIGINTSGTMIYKHNISPGNFYHVAATKNGDLYLNGLLGSQIAALSWAKVTFNSILIGNRSSGTGYLLNGSIIDQVRLFNKSTFTQQEVDIIYNEAAQVIDISSAGFINAPTRAVLKAPSIGICLEDETRRCISADYNVPITQAFNDTIVTSLPELNAVTRDCLDAGDDIVLTVDGSPVTTEILTIDKTTPNQYTITFAPQPTPPTACTVPSRAVAQTNPTPVGDWDGDDMTLEYDAVLKQGRALEISVQGDNTHEVAQVNVNLYKEVI